MKRYVTLLFLTVSISATAADSSPGSSTEWTGTRITSTDQHARTENPASSAHRSFADFILNELDLRVGDTVLDLGAGDGWWTGRIADLLGDDGVIYALEVETEKVDELRQTFSDDARVRPVLGETDSTLLPAECCDLVFISQVYHHLEKDGRVDYFRHLGEIIKPTGRAVVIERYTGIGLGRGDHGTRLADLVRDAEDGGWVLLRYELLPRTYYYVTIFAPKPLFPTEPPRGSRSNN